jgi:hypothetical protein
LKERFLMTVLPLKEILNRSTSIILLVMAIFKDILSFLLYLCFICGTVFGILVT